MKSVLTFSGKDKSLIFEQNKSRYLKYSDKIIHVIVEKFACDNPWDRETFQRNAIMRGLGKCDVKNNDIIILSDVDEIVRAHKIQEGASLLLSGKKKKAYAYTQVLYKYFLNRVTPLEWHGSIITTYQMMKKKTPQHFRNLRDQLPRISDGGWHFSSMGETGCRCVMQKI